MGGWVKRLETALRKERSWPIHTYEPVAKELLHDTEVPIRGREREEGGENNRGMKEKHQQLLARD